MSRSRRARALSLAALVAVVATVLVSCSSDDEGAAPLPEVRVGLFHTTDSVVYFAMMAQEIDREHGLALTKQLVQTPADIFAGMAAGTLDVAVIGSLPALAAARSGALAGKAVIVGANGMADPEHRTVAVLAANDVTDWRDLDGRTIGVNVVGSAPQVAGGIRFALEGVRDITYAEINLANQGLAVSAGDLGAALMVEPFVTQSVRRGDGHVLGWVMGDRPFPSSIWTFIIVRAGFARDHPDLVRDFLRARAEAVTWFNGHETSARSILASELGLDPDVARTVELARFESDARIDPDVLDAMQATLVAADPTATPVAAADLFDETLLLEALAGEE